MQRKRWTPKTEVTQSVVQFRQKRKWQIALRRYILEGHKSSYYAPYFGLGIAQIRQWIELQFDDTMDWDNFSAAWQFDHIIPVAFFDFENELDLKLCWNFTNIRVDKLSEVKSGLYKTDVLAARAYFEKLFQETGYEHCNNMVEKIKSLEVAQKLSSYKQAAFINEQKEYLAAMQTFDSKDFEKLNAGAAWQDLVFEKSFLKKYGG